MRNLIREKPLIRRTDKFEFRFYPESGEIRIVPLVVRYGEIVPADRGGITLRKADLQRMPEALEVLVALLNEWRVKRSQFPTPTAEQVERMKQDAEARRHIRQQRLDPS